jgi:hypothetical protein
MQIKALATCAISALLAASVFAADQPQSNSNSRISRDMRQAIAFERSKDRAAARQARIEARQSSANRSAAEKAEKPKK